MSLCSRPNPEVFIRIRLPKGGNTCDFCGGNDVTALYGCKNFIWNASPIFAKKTGHWAACWKCSELVDGKHWKALTTRVMREVSKREGLTDADKVTIRRTVLELHKTFLENRIGASHMAVLEPKVSIIKL